MRSLISSLIIFLGFVTGVGLAGCDLLGNEKSEVAGPVIIASMDGNAPGMWLFDPETLERVAIVDALEGRVPMGIAFSPNAKRWYVSWNKTTTYSEYRSVLAVLDPADDQIIQQAVFTNLPGGLFSLAYESVRDEIIAYGGHDNKVRFYDAETLDLVHELRIGLTNSFIGAAVVNTDRGRIYFGTNAGPKEDLIYVYDIISRQIIATIRLLDDAQRRSSTGPVDFALLPDGRHLYVTTFTSLGLDGYGAFFMVELETGEVMAERRAGKYAHLAVSPDGRHVYVDCPAGGLRSLVPTSQILRFDTHTRDMEVFVDGQEGLGLRADRGALRAFQIIILPDGKSLVITIADGVKNAEGKNVHMVRVDADSGYALQTYSVPRDDRGYINSMFRFVRFGLDPR